MTYTATHPLVVEMAAHFDLRVDLLVAQIQIESGGDSDAWNPEPRYRYLWDVRTQQPFRTLTAAELNSETPPSDFHALAGDPDQEWWAQQASWGLLQVIGGTAREQGFTGPYLGSLLTPRIGLLYGCQYLRWCLNRNHDDYRRALARFNGTGQQADAYASKVFALRDRTASVKA